MKLIHIIAGLLALVAGAIALYAAKGSKLHRKSGMVFVVAMLAMSSSGALMAVFLKPNKVNVMAGVLTFYLVSTGLLTVWRKVEQLRGLVTGFMLAAFAASAFGFGFGLEALNSPDGKVDGIPAPPLFMFGTVGLLGALGDARLLWARSIEGARRIARHLWRMSFAMWIATTSFFLGQAKVFPEPLRHATALRAIPVILVIGIMLYWLARVLIKRDRAVAIPLRHTGAGGVD